MIAVAWWLGDLRHPLDGGHGTDLRAAEAPGETSASATTDANGVRDQIVHAEEPLERGTTTPEQTALHDCRAVNLGTDQQLAVCGANASGAPKNDLAAEVDPGEPAAVRAVVEASAHCIIESAKLACKRYVWSGANLAIAGERGTRARRQPHARAERARNRTAILPEQTQVPGQPQVAERGALIDGVLLRADQASIAAHDWTQGQVRRQTQSLPQHQAATEMQKQLVRDQWPHFMAVAIVDDERLVAVVRHQPKRRSRMTA